MTGQPPFVINAGDTVLDSVTQETGLVVAVVSNWGVVVYVDYRQPTQHQRNYVWSKYVAPGDPCVENRLVVQGGPVP